MLDSEDQTDMGARRSQIDQAVQVSPPPPVDPYAGTARKIVVLGESQNWRCAYCGIPMDYSTPRTPRHHAHRHGDQEATVDHVIPRCHGGKATWNNEVAACAWCNTLKGEFSAAIFLEAIALFPDRTRLAFKAALRWMISARAADKRRARKRAKRQRKRARHRQQQQASMVPALP